MRELAKVAHAAQLLKHAAEGEMGPMGHVGAAIKKVQSKASAAGRKLTEGGHPIAGAAVALLPTLTAGASLYGASQTETGQKALYKLREWNYRRKMRKQMQGG